MNAFDKSLKGLDTSVEGKVTQTVTNAGLDLVVKGGAKWVGNSEGLYGSFVRGEVLGGTIGEERVEEVGKKRRRDGETKEERRARKAAKRAKRVQESTAEDNPETEEFDVEGAQKLQTKDERKERRRQKRLLKDAERNAVEASSEKAKKKKRRKE